MVVAPRVVCALALLAPLSAAQASSHVSVENPRRRLRQDSTSLLQRWTGPHHRERRRLRSSRAEQEDDPAREGGFLRRCFFSPLFRRERQRRLSTLPSLGRWQNVVALVGLLGLGVALVISAFACGIASKRRAKKSQQIVERRRQQDLDSVDIEDSERDLESIRGDDYDEEEFFTEAPPRPPLSVSFQAAVTPRMVELTATRSSISSISSVEDEYGPESWPAVGPTVAADSPSSNLHRALDAVRDVFNAPTPAGRNNQSPTASWLGTYVFGQGTTANITPTQDDDDNRHAPSNVESIDFDNASELDMETPRKQPSGAFEEDFDDAAFYEYNSATGSRQVVEQQNTMPGDHFY